MINRYSRITRRGFVFARRRAGLAVLVVCLLCLARATHAQTFSSGSTGADGAFAPTATVTLQVPENGVFNFTTITVPAGVDITFRRNSRNTPVTLLATGDVVINGQIFLDGQSGKQNTAGGQGAAGGFDGGSGGSPVGTVKSGGGGNGPGGGSPGVNPGVPGGGAGFQVAGQPSAKDSDSAPGGTRYGARSVQPLIGGSGGGGGAGSLCGN